LRIILVAIERVRAAFAVADLIDDEHKAAGPCPRHTHVLQLAIPLAAVMSVGDQDARHRLGRFRWNVQVADDPLPGPTLVDELLDDEAVAVDGAGGADVELRRRRGEVAERLAQPIDPNIAELFPLLTRLDLLPLHAVARVDLP